MLLLNKSLAACTLAVGVLAVAALGVPALAGSDDDPAARGTTPEAQKGYDIAARADRSDLGFGDSEVTLTMVLRNAAGAEAVRELTIATLEKVNESVGDKTLVSFQRPRDIRGTGLLSYAKILEPDDQWLYLPALKRVKRISSANKSGPFVGSEFAFEDFTALELNKFTYNYVGEGTEQGMAVDIVERFPRYENSGYTRQIAYVDQEVFQVRKVEFYDRKNALLKTLTLTEYREYAGGIWRAHRLAMVNHQTGKETDLVFSDFRFGTGLTESDFAQARLKRLR